jgi:hypothetical protein
VIGSGFSAADRPQVSLSGTDESGNAIVFATDPNPRVLSATVLRVRARPRRALVAPGKGPPGGFGFGDLSITVTNGNTGMKIAEGTVDNVSYDAE